MTRNNNKARTVVIVGPSPENLEVGGVAVFVRTLLSLSPFRSSRVLDPRLGVSSKLGYVARALKIGWQIRVNAPDIVIFNLTLSTFGFLRLILMAILVPKSRRGSVQVFCHGGAKRGYALWTIPPFSLLFQFVMLSVRCIWFLTDEQRHEFSQVMPKLVTARYMNYSAFRNALTCERKSERGKIRVLYVGRLIREKGLMELMAAVEELDCAVRNDFDLTIVGDGPLYNTLLKRCESAGSIVCLKGRLEGEDLEEMYKKADLFILPSYAEAFPYVFIECMRAGVPIIATPVGALATHLKVGYNGWFVEIGSSTSIKSALMHVHINRETLSRMKANCKSLFESRFSSKAAEEFYLERVL